MNLRESKEEDNLDYIKDNFKLNEEENYDSKIKTDSFRENIEYNSENNNQYEDKKNYYENNSLKNQNYEYYNDEINNYNNDSISNNQIIRDGSFNPDNSSTPKLPFLNNDLNQIDDLILENSENNDFLEEEKEREINEESVANDLQENNGSFAMKTNFENSQKESNTTQNANSSLKCTESSDTKKTIEEEVINLFKPVLYDDRKTEYTHNPHLNKNNEKIIKIKKRNIKSRSLGKNTSERSLGQKKGDISIKKNQEINRKKIINENSEKLILKNFEKNIVKAVQNNENKGEIDFLGVAHALTELRIFRVFPPKNSKTDDEIKNLRIKLKNCKENDNDTQGLKAEIRFLEQMWIILKGINNEKTIKSDFFCNFMTLLYSPDKTSIKETSEVINQFLKTSLFMKDGTVIRMDSNLSNESLNNIIDNSEFITDISERYISYHDIWSIPTLVKNFQNLRKNRIAYINIKNLSKSAEKDIKEIEKNITLSPIINKDKSNLIFRRKNINYNEQALLRQKTLERIKKLKEQTEFEQCTFQPVINKRANDDNLIENLNAHDRLYQKAIILNDKKQQKIIEQNKVNLEKQKIEYPFRPKIIKVSQKKLNRSFESKKKPKGYDEFVENYRKGVIKNLQKNYLIKKIPVGENYEKIKNMNIEPFDLTTQKKKDSTDNKDYITIELFVQNGKKQILKINKDDDTDKIVNNFCKTFYVKNDIKKKLINVLRDYKKEYLK
jgi:hypothetical protein